MLPGAYKTGGSITWPHFLTAIKIIYHNNGDGVRLVEDKTQIHIVPTGKMNRSEFLYNVNDTISFTDPNSGATITGTLISFDGKPGKVGPPNVAGSVDVVMYKDTTTGAEEQLPEIVDIATIKRVHLAAGAAGGSRKYRRNRKQKKTRRRASKKNKKL